MRNDLTQVYVQYLFDYNPEEGLLIWKNPNAKNVKRGDMPGSGNSHGYSVVGIDNTTYLAHRVIWLFVYGYWPENEIDHLDRDKANNRINNLREVSSQCNSRNAGMMSTNTSGVCGVRFHKIGCKWEAQIKIDGKSHYLGLHADYYDAVCTRLAAEQCLNWHLCDTDSTALKCVNKWIATKTEKINTKIGQKAFQEILANLAVQS